jgi:hypothetical protein
LRRHSSHRRGVRAVGLSIKNRRTWLRRLSGAEAKGAGLKSAERSRSQRSSRGAFDSAQAPPRALVLRVDRSQLQSYSANGKGVSAVGLTIKNRLTRLRRLSGAEAKGAGLKSAERSRSQRSFRGAFDSAQAPPRAWVLRVDRSQLRRFSANGRGVSAVGLSIKYRLTRLRRLSGAEAKGAEPTMAERSRRWLSGAEANGAKAVVLLHSTQFHNKNTINQFFIGLCCDFVIE